MLNGCEPAKSAPGDLSIAIVGDIMLGRGISEIHSGSQDWSRVFSAIQPALSQSDLRIGNLESPITSAKLKNNAYDLHAPSDSISALSSVPFELLCFNNNHSLDGGEEGLIGTKKELAEAGISLATPDAPFEIISFQEISLGIACLNDTDDSNPQAVFKEIFSSAVPQPDYWIVYIHWGGEYQAEPSAHERYLARALGETGADIIVGSHPHVIQPVEELRIDNRTVWAIYSLGNAIFDQGFQKSIRESAILQVDFQKNAPPQLSFIPFVIDPSQGITRLPSTQENQTILETLHTALPLYSEPALGDTP